MIRFLPLLALALVACAETHLPSHAAGEVSEWFPVDFAEYTAETGTTTHHAWMVEIPDFPAMSAGDLQIEVCGLVVFQTYADGNTLDYYPGGGGPSADGRPVLLCTYHTPGLSPEGSAVFRLHQTNTTTRTEGTSYPAEAELSARVRWRVLR